MGLMYNEKNYLNQNWLKSIYYSFIHTCLNYVNTGWESNKKKKLFIKQKQLCRLTCNEDRFINEKNVFA